MKLFILLCLVAYVAADATTASKPTDPTTTTASPQTSTNNPEPIPVDPAINPLFKFELKKGDVICAKGEFTGQIVFNSVNVTRKLDSSIHLDTEKSTCDDKEVFLKFKLVDDSADSLSFSLNKSDSSYQLYDIGAIYTGTKDHASSEEVHYNNTVLSVVNGNSYVCFAEQTFQMLNKDNAKVNATLSLKDLKLDAFRTEKTDEYRTASECVMDKKPNDLVPLAVAIALVSLIVIVLISYLIGRKRSRRLAYESV